MEFISSNVLKDWTWATEVKIIDLPVNPISHLLITLSGFNATDESTLTEILGFLNEVEVTHRGASVLDLESEDLFALNCFLLGAAPVLSNSVATDNMARDLTLVVPLGRSLFNPDECYPSTRRGELQLRLDCTVPATTFDNGVINVQAIELIGAEPKRYMKATLLKISAPGATGDLDVDLPVGNKFAGIMIMTTTGNQATTHTKGIDEARVLVDNREFGYVSGKFSSHYGAAINRIQSLARVPAAAGTAIMQNYALLDFDPAFDSNFLLDTKGKASLKVRLTMGVDEAAKVLPIEIVEVAESL
jgi:hypothetical protein